MDDRRKPVDPIILEILGFVSQTVGIAEHFKHVVGPTHRHVERRHKQVSNQVERFSQGLDEARTSLRIITSVVAEADSGPAGAAGFLVSPGELSVYANGLKQLRKAIEKMANAVYKLESVTQDISSERERFYRISAAGRPVVDIVLKAHRDLLEGELKEPGVFLLPSIVEGIDRYLTGCAQELEDRDRWLTL